MDYFFENKYYSFSIYFLVLKFITIYFLKKQQRCIYAWYLKSLPKSFFCAT